MIKTTRVITQANLVKAFVHADGLFRSLKKGERKLKKMDFTYIQNESESYRFTGFEPLDGTDLLVLQGLCAYAQAQIKVDKTQMFKDGHAHKKTLYLEGDALTDNIIALRFNFSEFLQKIGYMKTGPNIKMLKDSLLRLNSCLVYVQKDKYYGAYRILSKFSIDLEKREVVVCLNPLLTSAALGNGSYLRMPWHEITAKKSAPARLIHARLSWINEGRIGKIGIDKLIRYLYPDQAEFHTLPSTKCERKKTAIEALLELRNIGWIIHEYDSDKFHIERPPKKEATFSNVLEERLLAAA